MTYSNAPSPKQLDVLKEIARHTSQCGFAPSFRELAEFLGSKSKPASMNWVSDVLRALEDKGLVIRHHHMARAMVLTPGGRRWCHDCSAANDNVGGAA